MARSQNFTVTEMHTLLTCLEGMKGLIMPDVEPGYKSFEEQKKGWEYITCVVNSLGEGMERSASNLKNKWMDLKYRTKKKITMHNRKLSMGIGTPRLRLNDIEQRVLKLIGTSSTRRTSTSALTEETEDMSERDESFTEMDSDKQHVTSSEVLLDDIKLLTPNAGIKTKHSSTERVRRHRLKVQSQQDNIEDFIFTQKKIYDSMKHIETRTQESIDIGKTIVKNQDKMINKLDSVVMLMSDLNGHMENLNDNLNILTQLIATKTGIEIVENE